MGPHAGVDASQHEEISRQDLISLYRHTHRDYFAAELASAPSAADVDDLHHAPFPTDGYVSNLYNPDAASHSRSNFAGGGSSASTCSSSLLAEQLGLVSGDNPSTARWTPACQSASSTSAGKVDPLPDYTFVREVKRSVAVDDRTVLHHLPTFVEPIMKRANRPDFDRIAYEDRFENLEYSLNFDRPRLNTIMYEFLRRLTSAYPAVSLDDNPRRLSFLPTDVPDVFLLPQAYEMLPFPQINPSTSSGLYGDPSVRMELGQWVKGGYLSDHWTGRLRVNEGLLCPMAACEDYDCELHSAVIEPEEAVKPRPRGLPPSTLDLLASRPKPCASFCFAKLAKDPAHELARVEDRIASGQRWPDQDLDQLMALMTTMPHLLPCEMVELFHTDDGVTSYACYEIFIVRATVVCMTPKRPRPSSIVPLGPKKQKNVNDFNLAHGRMKTTRPCNHTGPCNGNQACKCRLNKIHCEKACGCDLTCQRRFGVHARTPTGGCSCHNSGTRCRTQQCECFRDSRDCDPNICRSCGAHDPESGLCSNLQIQLGRTKETMVLPTRHGSGLFLGALESVEQDGFIIEYIGELISHDEGYTRGMIYDQIRRNYMFDLNASLMVDGFSRANVARFINHPDENKGEVPNCRPQVLHVLGEHRVGIFANRYIRGGEELFFDYGTDFQLDSQNHPGTQERRYTQDSQPVKKGRPKKQPVFDLDSTPEL